ncbi:major intrinsically disordered NOTCH2-binding receptor 1-like [Pleurodeles waltl]|uniref:major intrinsically disordered NOTCH2-binding receptor 1-like n=1 Tax=Pleurodeles waltl TaxID=8319 RepID=UPI0037093F37
MDLSVLPNNNHPDKFLRLDAKSLMVTSAFLQARQWHNRVYQQFVEFLEGPDTVSSVEGKKEDKTIRETTGLNSTHDNQGTIDKAISKHITPVTLKSTTKNNPLYQEYSVSEAIEEKKKQPSWTIKEYDEQSVHPHLAHYLKENPNDLQFWLEDIYTPGYDSLLKKKEKEKKHLKYCRIILLLVFVTFILITIIILIVIFT